MTLLNLFLIALVGYLSGSIPTSVWIGKAFYGKDVRDHGSGNAGATNVYRVLGWKPAIVVILVDITKGTLPTLFAAKMVFTDLPMDPVYLQLLAGFAAIAGHCWTLFAGFRGGKGIATAGGMLLALFPVALPICIGVFVLVVATTRYVSLASMLAVCTLPITLLIAIFIFNQPLSWPLLGMSLILAPFALFTHRTNILRLMNGTENRFVFKKK